MHLIEQAFGEGCDLYQDVLGCPRDADKVRSLHGVRSFGLNISFLCFRLFLGGIFSLSLFLNNFIPTLA